MEAISIDYNAMPLVPRVHNRTQGKPTIYLIFDGSSYAKVLWSMNLDDGDIPAVYPVDLAAPGRPGIVDSPNMTKLSRMQVLYRWQPFLPFLPIHLHTHPWASRYAYKYDTLPIVQTGPKHWSLEERTRQSWASHAAFFIQTVGNWRGNLSLAPCSVDYQYSLRDYPIEGHFETEKKARGYFWHCRTMLFMIFAEFSFIVSARPRWLDELKDLYRSKNQHDSLGWLDELDSVLADFRYTKRAGVVVDVGSMDEALFPFIKRYHENGVPVLMDVGHVIFHDNDDIPGNPYIYVTSRSHRSFPSTWPDRQSVFNATQAHIKRWYPWRCDSFIVPRAIRPLTVSRPFVEEAGGVLHQQPPTTPWVNPATNEPTDLIRVAAPVPASQTGNSQKERGLNWVDFFARRREVNERILANETPVERQRRESRLKDSLLINQTQTSGPSKKSGVYKWVQEESPAGISMNEGWVGGWKRVKIDSKEVQEEWEEYAPTQRLYDPFHNQWDLLKLLDVDACPDRDFDSDSDLDDEDNMYKARIPVDEAEPVAYLDQIEDLAPESTIYSAVHSLSSQIAFLAPKRLVSWAYANLGLLCVEPLSPPLVYEKTKAYVGFFIDEASEKTPAYSDLQEFVFYIVERKFSHPRLSKLSDLHPDHHSPLSLSTVNIRPVHIDQTIIQPGPHRSESLKAVSRTGYVISPANDQSDFKAGWILLVFEAISVVQIARNKWAKDSMEDLVRHLVRHGIEFRTLAPVVGQTLSSSILDMTTPPVSLPAKDKKKDLDGSDYAAYVEIREKLVWSSHCKAIFRYGGIMWRLAMDCEGSFSDVIDSILDGPSELGSLTGEYFDIEGKRYYDDCIPRPVADTVTGTFGDIGPSYWPTMHSWEKQRWGTLSTERGNLMWNHRDEDFFQKQKAACIAGSTNGQPRAQGKWKKCTTHKERFDAPFEEYCRDFLIRSLL